jgi:hypothetical protein
MNKKIVYMLIVGVCLLGVRVLTAKYRTVESAGKLYEYIEPQVQDQLTLTAVLFYDSSEGEKAQGDRKAAQKFRSNIKKLINKQREAFKQASKGFSEVDFLSVDLKSNKTQPLAKAYAIAYSPEVRLFKRGKPFKRNNSMVALKGDFAQGMTITEPSIAKFVNKYFSDDVQKILVAKAKAAQELQIARASAPRYSNFNLGVGYGWGGYPGWGWGGGWGWGWSGGWRGCC